MKAGPWSARLGPQARERLAVACLAFLAGTAPPVLWWWPQHADVAQLEDELDQLRSRLASSRAAPLPARAADAPAPDWPLPEESAQVWSWLQQGAQAHGLQVLALQPLPRQGGADLPEQPVRLRLLGAWPDWLAFVAALDGQAPWWLVDQWQVVPDGQTTGLVRIDVQARLGLQPPTALATAAGPRVWPEWRQTRASAGASPGAGAGLLAKPRAAGPAAAAVARAQDLPETEASAPLPADPRLWPVRHLQLLGVWWQAGEAHAVLGQGLAQFTVSTGQRIGREAYRVRRIGAAGVELQAPGASGREAVLTLTWSGER
jgi:hypothetical protein